MVASGATLLSAIDPVFGGADGGTNSATARANVDVRRVAAEDSRARRDAGIAWPSATITADACVVPEMRDVARVVDEGDVAGLRVFDARDALDVDVPRAAIALFEAALQPVGEVAKLHQRARCDLAAGTRATVEIK